MKSENKDWTGNSVSYMKTSGYSTNSQQKREDNDYYATEPKAVRLLMEMENWDKKLPIFEPACGQGHLSEELKKLGYDVISTDLIDRGYGVGGMDFLKDYYTLPNTNILTNPPYKYANQFIIKSLEMISDGNKVAMFLPIRYLEGKARKKLFAEHPPKTIYISSSRLKCAINGNFDDLKGSAVAYSWFVWEKGYKGETIIKWFN